MNHADLAALTGLGNMSSLADDCSLEEELDRLLEPRNDVGAFRAKIEQATGRTISAASLRPLIAECFGSSAAAQLDEPPAKKARTESPIEAYCRANLKLTNFSCARAFAAIAYAQLPEERRKELPLNDALVAALYYRMEHKHMVHLLNSILVTLNITNRARIDEQIYKAEILRLCNPEALMDSAVVQSFKEKPKA